MSTFNIEETISFMQGDVMDIGLAIKANRPEQIVVALSQLRNRTLEVMNEAGIKATMRKNSHTPQDVFIGDIAFHAYIKLQSAVGLFCTAAYLNNIHMIMHAMHSVEYYINYIANQYVVHEPRALTATSGEAKAPLVAKSTRKKGKK